MAFRKAQALIAAGANLKVVAESIGESIEALCVEKGAELVKSVYKKEYLGDAVLVIAATDDRQLNTEIYNDCRAARILCNVVDVPELCDFYVPAIVRRGDLQIAVGTDGHCPAYAGAVRRQLEQIFTDKHGEFLVELDMVRKRIIEEVQLLKERKRILKKLVNEKSFEYFIENGRDKWRGFADNIIAGKK